MNFSNSNDGFLPYDSFDSIFAERKLPEFGEVASPYKKVLTTWKFFLARNEAEIPFGFEGPSFDDTEWQLIDVPSVWQMEGYGLPQNLLHNYPLILEKNIDKKDESISDKYILNSVGSEEDEVGIYRSNIVLTSEDIDRAIYLETSGICGSFEVYLNGKVQVESDAVLNSKRLLLSSDARVGLNNIAILVNRYQRDEKGHIVKEIANFGFSGIFRPIYLVKESLLEISNLHIKTVSLPAAYVNQMTGAIAVTEEKISKISHGDYLIKVDMKVTNHSDFLMPYSMKISLLETRTEYDPYKLPFVETTIDKPIGGTIDAHRDVVEKTEIVATNVAEWCDATPVQYDLVLELFDSQGRIICAKRQRFGFKTSEVILDKININNRRVPLKLIKYVEFDSKSGIAAPIDRMRQDIIMMKRCGLNGVIVQAFPLSDAFLKLCDQYGIYVMAQADKRVILDYVQSAMNHPSIICWGFPEFSYDEGKCKMVKNQCELVDDTRPWYCSIESKQGISDLSPLPSEAGAIFGQWVDLCISRKDVFDKNKTSKNLFRTIPGRTRFNDDDELFKWIHHADLVGGKQKEDSCIGQGIVDSLRNPHPIFHDIKKQCQMISIIPSADDPTSFTIRNTHPFAYTEEVVLQWKVMLGGNILSNGEGLITEIEPYGTRTMRFKIDIGKYLVEGWGEGNPESVEMYMKALSHEIVFDISLKLAKQSYYAEAGYEVAFFQEVLCEKVQSPVRTGKAMPGINAFSLKGMIPSSTVLEDTSPVKEITDGSQILASDNKESIKADSIEEESVASVMTSFEEVAISDNNQLEEGSIADLLKEETSVYAHPKGLEIGNSSSGFGFDRTSGAINRIAIDGFDFLKGAFFPSFYRCPSNVDRTDKSFVLAKTIFSKETDYEAIQSSLEFVGCSYGDRDGVYEIVSRYKSFAMKGDVVIFYEIESADSMLVTLCFTPKYDMVRYGLRVPIVKEDMLCKWYGRGPGESYYDRKNASRIGLFAAGADKIYHPYARPAENSSHTDTHTLELLNQYGNGLKITRKSSNGKFDFTVLPFTPEQMNAFLHEEQLMQNQSCELFLDFCTKEIERTKINVSSQPLKKNVGYKETFEIKLVRNNL